MWKLRQCGQVSEAYSTMVTGASSRPNDISGSVPVNMTSAMVGSAITSRPPAGLSLGSANGLNRSGPVEAVSSAVG